MAAVIEGLNSLNYHFFKKKKKSAWTFYYSEISRALPQSSVYFNLQNICSIPWQKSGIKKKTYYA